MNIKIYTQNVLNIIYYIHFPYQLLSIIFNTFWHTLKNIKIKTTSSLVSLAHILKNKMMGFNTDLMVLYLHICLDMLFEDQTPPAWCPQCRPNVTRPANTAKQ